jgi:hypothetical protein
MKVILIEKLKSQTTRVLHQKNEKQNPNNLFGLESEGGPKKK